MMPAVAPVEQMEQRAEQDQEVGQEAEEMGCVLGDQEKSGDREKYPQDDPTAQPQSPARRRLVCRCPRIPRTAPFYVRSGERFPPSPCHSPHLSVAQNRVPTRSVRNLKRSEWLSARAARTAALIDCNRSFLALFC